MTEAVRADVKPRLRRFDFSAQQAGAVAGVFYILGFVVSNASYARYEIVSLDLLQTRYLSAAILFLIGVGFPAGVGISAYFEIFRPNPEHRFPWLSGLVSVFSSLFFALPMWLLIAHLIFIRDVDYLYDVASFLGFTGLGCAAAFFSLHLGGVKTRQEWYIRRGMDVLVVFLILLFSAGWFGQNTYPWISPEFGGGAGWYGRIGIAVDVPNETLDTSILNEVKGSNVIVVDRDDQLTTFLACDRSRGYAIPVTVPTSRVRWQTTNGLMNPRIATERLCLRR